MTDNKQSDCQHDTNRGLEWLGVTTENRLFGLWKYKMILKKCNACGFMFWADTKGRRLYHRRVKMNDL